MSETLSLLINCTISNEQLHYFARVAIMKYHILGGLTQRNVFSHSSKAKNPRSGCQKH